MKFNISLGDANILTAMRRFGYAPEGRDEQTGEFRFWKSLTGRRYPRFHLYILENKSTVLCNLHLDQKAPSYRGASAHSGEYSGPLVEQEAERILNRIKDC